MYSKTASSPVHINAHIIAVLRLVIPQLPGSDGSKELHHSLVHGLVVQNRQQVLPGLTRPANALQHVLHQNNAQTRSAARVAEKLAEARLNIGYCDCSNLAHTSAKLVCK